MREFTGLHTHTHALHISKYIIDTAHTYVCMYVYM